MRFIFSAILIFISFTFAVNSLPEGIDDNWWSQVSQYIAASEYDISWQPHAAEYQSPNRAHNLRFSFCTDGFKVQPRVKSNTWSATLRLSGFGRFGNMIPYQGRDIAIQDGKASVFGNGVNIEFQNSEKGMREDFIIQKRINGKDELILEFSVHMENVNMTVEEDEIHFVIDISGGAEVLRYGDMKITDCQGTVLSGYFKAIDENSFAIVVDDHDVLYPIRIDPLSTTPNWTAESNQTEAYFGYSVSSAGDVNADGYSDVIVGAREYDNGQDNEGRAFVYHGSASGLSTTPNWTAESNQANSYFGHSVATAGDVNGDGYSDVIIGAHLYTNGQFFEGCAFVFHGSAAGLSTTPDWTGEPNQASAYFGYSVSTAGDVNGDNYSDVIIGAYAYDNGQSGEGRAYVYHGSAAGLSTTPDWTAESNQESAQFGKSVSHAGDVNGDGYTDVIIGALYYDNGQTNEGRAFLYNGSASGLSTTPDWTAESNQASAGFGISVSDAGDVNADGYSDVIVGASSYDNGQTNEGRAFLYNGSTSGLSTTPDWTAESDQDYAYFGHSVAQAGDVNGDGYSDVIVGAYGYSNGQSIEGSAFAYHGSATGLSASPDWTAESNQMSAWFGFSVSHAGDVNGDGHSDVIVGASQYDNGQTNEGRAFVYHGSASGLSATSDWVGESNWANAWFGFAVSYAGDVNADGYSDVIVGAPRYDNGEADEGCAFVYHGSGSGLPVTPDWAFESDLADVWFGHAVSHAGDVNADGYSDVIVGAPHYTNGQLSEGCAFVFHGSPSGLSMTPDWFAESDQASAWMGHAVSLAGDVNGDGYSDVIVGAPIYTSSQSNEGCAFVYHGSATGLSATPDWTAASGQEMAVFGISVSQAGDVNADGYSDVIVGAYYYDNGETDEGRAYVYHGSATGLSTTPDWTAESNQANAQFGIAVSQSGDVNGDGYSDVIVGAHWYDSGQTDEGRAYVYHGSAAGLSSTPDWFAESNVAGACFGTSVSTAGDVNGDGYADAIVGAPYYDSGQTDEGMVFVYHGSASGLSSPSWSAELNQAYAHFGYSVASVGDVNADGYSDVIVGGPYYSNGQTNEGGAFVYYGNVGENVIIQTEQLRPDFSASVVPALFTYSNSSFGARFWGRSFYGRALVRAQFEVKPLGTPFNGSGLIETDWTDIDTPGVEISQVLDGLVPNTLYKWRVRIQYHPKYGAPLHSRWYYIQSNGMTECDFRVGIEHGVRDDRSMLPHSKVNLIAEYIRGGMRFRYYAPVACNNGELVIYDLLGAEIDRVEISLHRAGEYCFEWHGSNRKGDILSNGVYFARVITDRASSNSVKFVLIR